MNEKNNLEERLNKNYMPIIYANIKKYRRESGLSIMEVAEKLNISTEYLRRIESKNDSVKTCSLKLLIKFSILFDKNLEDFLKENV